MLKGYVVNQFLLRRHMKYYEMVMGLKLVGLKMTTVWICNNPIIQTSSYHMFNP